MEIQVGEYIRTKDGVIAKVTATGYGIDCDRDVFDLKCLQMMEIPPEHVQEYVKKHSFNIIDLIEEGDYVNGSEVVPILGYNKDGNDIDEVGILKLYDDNDVGLFYLAEVTIKSIVTKEQFKAREYEVK